MHDPEIQTAPPGMSEPLTHGEASGDEQAFFLPTRRWLLEGLRAAFFRSPQVTGFTPAPWQVFIIALLVFGVEVLVSRMEIAGPARFDLQAWLAGWWTLPVFIGLAWWVFPAPASDDAAAAQAASRLSGVAGCFVLWLTATLPNTLLYEALVGGIVHGWIKSSVLSVPWFYWGLYGVCTAWSLGVSVFLIRRFARWTWRSAVFMLVLVAGTGLTTWQFEARAWEQDLTRAAEDNRPRLQLSQQVFEGQQALMEKVMTGLVPERPGITDVYGLVFAPFATEDVFLRESTMVSAVLAERFDAAGRVVHLLNHASTAQTHVWATPLNLQRAIDALAQRMDRDNDVLVVYLTSHGASDFKLAASHWPLEVEPLSPGELRAALDKAGIRHRVIAVSACYSGGWIDALADDDSLVMTAADATHTSYGCGRLSELTFFGRAMFDEQLRKTHSFEQAFTAAVPVIKQREIDAGKTDGFSNPQISVGEKIKPVLRALERRLAGS